MTSIWCLRIVSTPIESYNCDWRVHKWASKIMFELNHRTVSAVDRSTVPLCEFSEAYQSRVIVPQVFVGDGLDSRRRSVDGRGHGRVRQERRFRRVRVGQGPGRKGSVHVRGGVRHSRHIRQLGAPSSDQVQAQRPGFPDVYKDRRSVPQRDIRVRNDRAVSVGLSKVERKPSTGPDDTAILVRQQPVR